MSYDSANKQNHYKKSSHQANQPLVHIRAHENTMTNS